MKTDNLYTTIKLPRDPWIDLNSRIFFAGSCFTENVGDFMKETGFFTCINPFGIMYNPVSIATMCEKIATRTQYNQNDLVYDNERFISLEHHGRFEHTDAHVLLQKINTGIDEAHEFLQTCDVAIITPGTSLAYVYNPLDMVVANCHKIPNHQFNKVKITENAIIDSMKKCVLYLRKLNPSIKIIFTISPVKHLRDGIVENAASKARLISAIHTLTDLMHDPDIRYFPAYEIQTEELRDYRFYAEDLAHPTPWAVRYIFQKFMDACFTDSAIEFIAMAKKYAAMKQHRPRTNDEGELRAWATQIENSLKQIQDSFPDKVWP